MEFGVPCFGDPPHNNHSLSNESCTLERCDCEAEPTWPPLQVPLGPPSTIPAHSCLGPPLPTWFPHIHQFCRWAQILPPTQYYISSRRGGESHNGGVQGFPSMHHMRGLHAKYELTRPALKARKRFFSTPHPKSPCQGTSQREQLCWLFWGWYFNSIAMATSPAHIFLLHVLLTGKCPPPHQAVLCLLNHTSGCRNGGRVII